ncbi:MAG: hypothetical protein ACTSR2_09350, partial [Candidatus Hodarchaeales archaeon]
KDKVSVVYKKNFFSKKVELSIKCKCGKTHVQKIKINGDMERRGIKYLYYCPESKIGYKLELGNSTSSFRLKKISHETYSTQKDFLMLAIYAENAPRINITSIEDSVSESEATKDDPVINVNHFLSLSVNHSLDELRTLIEAGVDNLTFNDIFEYILLLYADYREDFEKRRQLFTVPEHLLAHLAENSTDDLSRAKLAYCYLMNNDYITGLSYLNQIKKPYSEELSNFLNDLYLFKIQNPFCVDGVILMRPLRNKVLSINEHLESNHQQVQNMLNMQSDPQDIIFHHLVYQINLVLLSFLAKNLNRDKTELQFINSKINLDGLNENKKNQLLQYI